jgi:hypothetical protein
MLRFLARFAVAAVFVAVAAIPVTASAAGGGGGGTGMTIKIGKPITLQNRLLVTVPVTYSCLPFSNPLQFGEIGVTVEQASRNSVSHGFGLANLFSCDSTPTTIFVQVTPDIQPMPSGPFHKGGAIAIATGIACDTGNVCEGGQDGWRTVRLS